MSQDEHTATWSAVDKLDEIRRLLGIGVHDDVVQAVRAIVSDRDYCLQRQSRAERALLHAGFTDNGGAEWKPPVNVEIGELRRNLYALEDASATVNSRVDTMLSEYAKLKAVAEGQDALISELRLALADANNDKRDERKRLTTERDAAELSALYFAKRLESQCHGDNS